jgi:hypothetical protein
LYLLKV